jgi:hypothetical protein
MNALKHKSTLLLAIATAISFTAATAMADPLPGRDLLKFSQKPMDQTQIFGQVYFGHDELSTAYAPSIVPAPPITQYRGTFMADDFADTLSTPVVHVKWWGSYLNASEQYGHVTKFLIAFENDVPTPNGLGFSYPDPNGPIHSQIVTLGSLSPGSGTFTESFKSGGGLPLNEDLYEYNAELAIPFPQQANTVHWLKIVALVDHDPSVQPGTPGAPVTQWGWHNRDYTQQNPSLYVAGPPQVSPGENQQGNAALFPIWHFQDDAVSGQLDVNTFIDPNGVQQIQSNGVVQHLPTFNDEYYIDNIDGPGNLLPGFQGISAYSKDLAFELYTTQIPEPASLALMAAGFAGAVACQRRMRKA